MKIKQEQLVLTLRDMANTVERNDSFEGSIQYTCFWEQEALEADEFEVSAFYRVGNSMGQGGCVLIQAQPYQPIDPTDIVDDAELCEILERTDGDRMPMVSMKELRRIIVDRLAK